MHISKDEAMVISVAMGNFKYDCANDCYTKEEINQTINAFDRFIKKLDEFAVDNRRFGRTSINDFSDILKRFIKKYSNE